MGCHGDNAEDVDEETEEEDDDGGDNMALAALRFNMERNDEAERGFQDSGGLPCDEGALPTLPPP
jgi:hypothetical protein